MADEGSSEQAEGRRRSAMLRALLAIALVLLLKVGAPLFLPVASAVVLAFALAPLVRALRVRGVPETLSAAVVVTVLAAMTLLVSSTLIGPASQWWERAPSTAAQVMAQLDRLRASILRPVTPASRPAAARPQRSAPEGADAPDPLKERLTTEGVALTRVLVGKLLSFGLSAAATVILLFFLLASEHWMLSRSVEAVPRRRSRALLVAGVRSVERDIGRFVASMALVNLGVALATCIAVWALGLPNPVLWGAVAGTMNFIPYIGPVITVALLSLAGMLTFDTAGAMLAPAAAFLLIHAIESNLISPWFVGRRLTLSPLAVFLSVMLWGWLWGIAGAMLAVPVLVGVRSVCKRRRKLRLWATYLEGAYRPAPSLRSLLLPRRRLGRPGGST